MLQVRTKDLPALPVPKSLPSGLLSVRAEGEPDIADVKKLLTELQKTFATFHSEYDEEVKALKKGQADIVKTEKVDKINSAVGELQTAVDRLNELYATLSVGGGRQETVSPEVVAYRDAFEPWFRHGDGENEIKAMLKRAEVQAALSIDSDPSGGFVSPPEMGATIDETIKEVSAMRSLAQVLTTSAKEYKKLVNVHGTGSGWVGERQSRPETDTPTLEELTFPSMTIYAMPNATQDVLEDAMIDIGGWLAGEVDLEFAQQEGAAFVLGTGEFRPRGFLSYTLIANANWEWNRIGTISPGQRGGFATAEGADYDNLIDLQSALLSGYRQNAQFVANRLTWAQVRKIKDADGNPTWRPSMELGQPASLLGDPATELPDMPDIAANSLSMAYGDFRRGYLIVDRRGVQVLRDPYTNKPYVQFYTTKRVGGGVQNFQAIKVLKFGTAV